MTTIIGGKYDISVRARQINRAIISATHQRLRDVPREQFDELLQRRAALFYGGYEKVLVSRKGKYVAAVKGPYLAKLIRKYAHGRFLSKIIYFVKMYQDRHFYKRKYERDLTPCVPIKLIEDLEKEKEKRDAQQEGGVK